MGKSTLCISSTQHSRSPGHPDRAGVAQTLLQNFRRFFKADFPCLGSNTTRSQPEDLACFQNGGEMFLLLLNRRMPGLLCSQGGRLATPHTDVNSPETGGKGCKAFVKRWYTSPSSKATTNGRQVLLPETQSPSPRLFPQEQLLSSLGTTGIWTQAEESRGRMSTKSKWRCTHDPGDLQRGARRSRTGFYHCHWLFTHFHALASATTFPRFQNCFFCPPEPCARCHWLKRQLCSTPRPRAADRPSAAT